MTVFTCDICHISSTRVAFRRRSSRLGAAAAGESSRGSRVSALDQTGAECTMRRQQQRPNHRNFDNHVMLYEKTPPPTHRNRYARLPLLLATGHAAAATLCLEVKKALQISAGLRCSTSNDRGYMLDGRQQRHHGLRARQTAQDRTASQGAERRGGHGLPCRLTPN